MRDKQLIICTGCNNPYVLGGFYRHGCVKKNMEKGVKYQDYSGYMFLYRWDEGLEEFVSIGVQRTATSSSTEQQPATTIKGTSTPQGTLKDFFQVTSPSSFSSSSGNFSTSHNLLTRQLLSPQDTSLVNSALLSTPGNRSEQEEVVSKRVAPFRGGSLRRTRLYINVPLGEILRVL